MDSSVDYAFSSGFVASGTTSEWTLVDSETEHVDFSLVLHISATLGWTLMESRRGSGGTLKRKMLIFHWFYKHFRDSRVDPGGIEDGLWWNLTRKMLIFYWF